MIRHDPEAHIYTTEDGERLPSVTDILSPLRDFSRVPRDVLARAAAWGEAVHRMVRLDLDSRLDESSLAPPLVPVLGQWRAARAAQGWTIVDGDVVVGDLTWGYAGRYDLVCRREEGLLDLIDVKTGRPALTDGPQLAAYAAAFPFEGHLLNLYLTPEEWVLVDRTGTRTADYEAFLACLHLWRYRQRA